MKLLSMTPVAGCIIVDRETYLQEHALVNAEVSTSATKKKRRTENFQANPQLDSSYEKEI